MRQLNFKLLKRLLLLLSAVIIPQLASAYDFMVNGLCYVINKDGTSVSVTRQNTSSSNYSNLTGALVIPGTVTYNQKTYSVTSVQELAFSNNKGITSVTFPTSVTSIGNGAFQSCSNLATVSATSSLSEMGDGVFLNTKWYNNKSNGMIYLGSVAYIYKGTISSGSTITITSGTKGIAGGCFSGQTGLKKITIPTSVTSIGGTAFYNCSNLSSATIPNSVTSIGEYAFYNCSSLSSISVPSSVVYIGDDAFLGTAWYNNKSNGLVYAGYVAYKYKGTMPSNTNITITNGTTGIAENCFRDCVGLNSITIPVSLQMIGNQAFDGCTGLTKVNISNIASWCSIDFGKGNYYGIGTNPLEYAHHLYLNNEEITQLQLPSYNGNLRIKSQAFYGCTGLTSLEIGSAFISIDRFAFYGCSGLTNVTINNSVKSIGRYAFEGCTNLASITLPYELNFMDDQIFERCTNLNSIYFKNENPADIATFGCLFDTFDMNCTLHVLTGTANIYRSNSYWQNCYIVDDLLPEIYFVDDAVKQICLNKWDTNEDGELSYEEAATVTNLGLAFHWNNDIERFPELQYFTNLKSINSSAFSGCNYLYEIVFPEGLETIEANAFTDANISTVNLPASVKTIVGTPFDGHFTQSDEYDWWYVNCPSRYNVAADNQYFSSDNGLLYNKDKTILIDIPYAKSGTISLPNTVKSCQDAFNFYDINKIYVNTRTWYEMDLSNKPKHTYTDYDEDDNPIECDLIYDGTSVIPYRGNVILPDGIQKIGSRHFESITNLYSISIPNTVSSIGERAFYGCSGLTSLSIPNSVTSIGDNAFRMCRNINSIIVEAGNSTYDSRNNCNAIIETSSNILLYGCNNSTIPNSVTSIDVNAFQNCNRLSSVDIPNTITSIGSNAFSGCNGLSNIYCYIDNPSSVTMGTTVFNNVPTSTCTLYVPYGSADLYRNADQWNAFTNIVEMAPPTVLATSVALNQTEAELTEGETLTLSATVLPDDATDKTVTWSSSNETVATVENGVVTAVAEGTTTITATTIDGSNLSASCALTVNPLVILATSVALNQTEAELTEGETLTLTATVLPDDATDKTVTWSSSNENVATVVDGVVTAVAEGTATITATTSDGSNLSASCTLTVNRLIVPGDANGDNSIDATDYVATANYILGDIPENFDISAIDLDNNGVIDVADLVGVTNMILNANATQPAPQYAGAIGLRDFDMNNRLYVENIAHSGINTYTVSISLDNQDAFTALQADIYLPEDVALSSNFILSDRKAKDHSITSQVQPDGAIRIFISSPGSKNLRESSGEIVSFQVQGNIPTALEIKRIIASTDQAVGFHLQDFNLQNVVTGIDSLFNSGNGTDDTYYNILGIPVENPTPGIYIKKGQKVIVK